MVSVVSEFDGSMLKYGDGWQANVCLRCLWRWPSFAMVRTVRPRPVLVQQAG